MLNNDLISTIQAMNAKTVAWVSEDPSSRWATTLVEDPTHWADVGVTTGAELAHYLDVCNTFELHREAWGFKPSWSRLMAMTAEELRAEQESCRTMLLNKAE